MTPGAAETRALLRTALIRAYVVEQGLPDGTAELIDALSRPAPARSRASRFGWLHRSR